MIETKLITQLQELSLLKKAYFEEATVPLDGMWHFGFVAGAPHFGFYIQDKLVGFCCINDDKYLLQYFVNPEFRNFSNDIFAAIVNNKNTTIGTVAGAFVSTAELYYQSLCMDNAASIKVNALMCQHQNAFSNFDSLEMIPAAQNELESYVRFAVDSIGAPEQWLIQYYGNLIDRQELFGYWQNDELIAAGECRLFDEYQTEYAEVGMIIAKSERGKGLARKVLKFLIKHADSKNLKAICSTEIDNIAAQKAIVSAGFRSEHRIVQYEFN